MRCPICNGGGLRVIEPRRTENSVRRRRLCQCGHEWTTWEWSLSEGAMKALRAAMAAFSAAEEVEVQEPVQPASVEQAVMPGSLPMPRSYSSKGVSLPRIGEGWHS